MAKVGKDGNSAGRYQIKPQNIEQGILNFEVIITHFCGSLFCPSTRPTRLSGSRWRAGIRYSVHFFFDGEELAKPIQIASG